MNNKPEQSEREKEAKRILERVAQESETIGTSSTKRVANRVKDHLGAADVNENEWAELWGTRIGRTLGAIFFIGLVIYMLRTYVFHI